MANTNRQYWDPSLKDSEIAKTLGYELMALENIHGQNPDTGSREMTDASDSFGFVGKSYLGRYTNRLFGAPYQFLDSVDKRFHDVNENLGSEYLRNIMLNSPILYIKPGKPVYTGNQDKQSFINNAMKSFSASKYGAEFNLDISGWDAIISALATSTIFGSGARLQTRMFGFRETYNDYMHYVNYMCHCMSMYLGLITVSDLDGALNNSPRPWFTPTSNSVECFKTMDWRTYRMLNSTSADDIVTSSFDMYKKLITEGTVIGNVIDNLSNLVNNPQGIEDYNTADNGNKYQLSAGETNEDGSTNAEPETIEFDDAKPVYLSVNDITKAVGDAIWNGIEHGISTTATDILAQQVQSVQFLVKPISISERLRNDTANSFIETAADGANEIGSEIAFITGSQADTGMLGEVIKTLGDTAGSALQNLAGVVNHVIGGSFASDIFNGVLGSVTGQKMIYPKIYKSSESTTDFQFTVVLSSPYGDVYNYYMNEIVPLCHLIPLAAPRLVTGNSTTSPFLVQAYIPGMCTCQMGIIRDMEIKKNPTAEHVSVNGFPLTIEVTFTVEELYNALAVSPDNNPASFVYNETLNDYMANLSGLAPSFDTDNLSAAIGIEAMGDWWSKGGLLDDIGEVGIDRIKAQFTPST